MVMLEEDLKMKPMERDIVGRTYARIEIPLTSALALRDAADMLRGLANDLDFQSRQERVKEVTKLVGARMSIDSTRRRLRLRGEQDEQMFREEEEAARNRGTYNGHTVNSNNRGDSKAY